MERAILLAGFALGLLFVIIYVIRCMRGARVFSVGVMVMIVLPAAGIVGGIVLAAKIFLPTSLRAQLTGLSFDLYSGIGGLAVVAVSVQRIYREVFARNTIPPSRTSP